MARVKRGVVSRRKHKKLHDKTRGFRGTKSRLIRAAHEAALHSGAYAYHGRKLRKRDNRSLWIVRIGEAARKEGLSYSTLMDKLKKSKIELDRKTLSDLVQTDPETFSKIVSSVK
ncbi:MAG: 50S ribosomal protein L20 [Candidatus Levybacteria bacterium RIFOXYA1_FULL_41_10]|nr:MAG: 50S ribosomal protein L20 [Candidatus Levybacteria bacterium GW2011_GWA1_39_32]KKR50123.1 MAG: 50S ribosomal protein L20 [Candidatus Levybacteria bacterium GW2011_GWC1_40_19]KKR94971.1 MAG: 50S ribosomal protein L20 [Candidatus Levybacteria bacterium GW2011_GWA2_41_15]OGH21105.1 MAG: 50S ribosomal protein L20 [Candidatus Levybacteria bacterium RIFCSPHIGHO2_01_FULL_40_83]OGH27669.1 MAG: 50S ribosomal protein L20 [Candidatus Levybacteria bacterium RIFCSPHIGHO2_02_FULL_40_29]OGH32795.1 MA